MRETFEYDPKEAEVLGKVRKINETLAEASKINNDGRERLLGIISHINNEWPHYGKEVVVSGWMRASQKGINDDYSIKESAPSRLHAPVKVLSLGFELVIIESDDEYGDDEIFITHLIGFDVNTRGEIIEPEISKYPMFVGRAKIDDMTMKDALEDHHDLMTYLENYYPKETDDISDCIKDANSEIEVLENMRGVVIDISEVQNAEELNEQFSRYISRDIVFDKVIPYSAKFKGRILEMNKDGFITGECAYAEDWQDVVLIPEEVVFLPELVEDADEVLGPSDSTSVPYLITEAYRHDDIVSRKKPAKFVQIAIPLSDQLVIVTNNENIKEVNVDQE